MTGAAPLVEFRFPAVLKVVLGTDRVKVRAGTLPEALEAAYAEVPRLRYHIALESGDLRPHVLCILNSESVPRDEVATTGLAEGDEIWIHQAISGG
ncbi:MAG: MoaD/ThiS family protein [Planctomycetota bacterium]|jgi:sulfur carrier protein ThiS